MTSRVRSRDGAAAESAVAEVLAERLFRVDQAEMAGVVAMEGLERSHLVRLRLKKPSQVATGVRGRAVRTEPWERPVRLVRRLRFPLVRNLPCQAEGAEKAETPERAVSRTRMAER